MTSSRITRPSRPLPSTFSRLIPSASALSFAEGFTGEAFLSFEAVSSASEGSVEGSSVFEGSSSAGGASPSSKVAITVPIATVSPSGTTICNVPDASAFNSTLTLSVSSSQMTSSFATMAPSSFSQLATRASRIDSPISGIFISMCLVLAVQCTVNDLLLLFFMAAMRTNGRSRRRTTPAIFGFLAQRANKGRMQMRPWTHIFGLFLDPGDAFCVSVTSQYLF